MKPAQGAATGPTRSVWMTLEPFVAPALDASIEADVVITGAGIAGLSVAYELAVAGRSVVVLDPGPIGGRLAARTSGQLGFEADDLYAHLIKRRGLDEARQIHLSQRAAVDRVEQIVREEGIDCGFARVDGYLIPADVEGRELIDPEYEACRQVGLTDVAYADDAPIAGVDTGACLRFPDQARLDPARYCRGLAQRLQARGVRFFADTTVVDLEEQPERVRLRTATGHTIFAEAVVVATASPLDERIALDKKQVAYRTYLLAARTPKGASPDILLWDTASPQHQVRLLPGAEDDLLIIGGEDHRLGREDDAEERFARLELWARGRYPEMGESVMRWSGTVYEPTDHAPFIGQNPGSERVYVVTGDSRQALTTGAASGLILSDLIQGRASPWAAAYHPGRKPMKALGDVFKDNFDAAATFVEQVTGSDAVDPQSLEPGQGGVIKSGSGRAAAYREEDGSLTLLSAACTHGSCTVQFNSLERSWDCPCHGCQYGLDGTVLNGPAHEPLPQAPGG
jgi:glycine/D-amino acid oxidase-like deaminating enzyme/nitrite reductase/ring-hydroxylating ferredoxin subunit